MRIRKLMENTILNFLKNCTEAAHSFKKMSQTNSLKILPIVSMFLFSTVVQAQSVLNIDQFKAEIETATAAANFSGVVLVAKDNKILFNKAYGYRDIEHKLANQTDTRFITASITKMITSSMIAILWDQGKINLDAPISAYLPQLAVEKPKIANAVTIRQLLSHSSGLGNYKAGDFWGAANKIDTLSKALPYMTDEKPAFVPSSSYLYSNNGYLLLGLIIEQVLQTDYYTAIQEYIFDPLHMTKSGFYPLEEIVENRAKLYTKLSIEKGGFVSDLLSADPWLEGRGGPGGGLTSTVEDLLKFSEAYFKGTLLSDNARSLFQSPQVPRRTRSGQLLRDEFYGYGLGLLIPNEMDKRVGHAGGDPGTSSLLFYFPGRDITIIMLSNRDTFSGASSYIDFSSLLLNSLE